MINMNDALTAAMLKVWNEWFALSSLGTGRRFSETRVKYERWTDADDGSMRSMLLVYISI